jgi:hypothetical protein
MFSRSPGVFGRHLRAANLSPKTIEVYLESAHEFASFLAKNHLPQDVDRVGRVHWEDHLVRVYAHGQGVAVHGPGNRHAQGIHRRTLPSGPARARRPGHAQLPPSAAKDRLEVFVRRYEHGSIILTTNRPLEDWGQVLGHAAAAGALLDRFLHHAEVIRLKGRSYRIQHRTGASNKNEAAALTAAQPAG